MVYIHITAQRENTTLLFLNSKNSKGAFIQYCHNVGMYSFYSVSMWRIIKKKMNNKRNPMKFLSFKILNVNILKDEWEIRETSVSTKKLKDVKAY